MSVEKSTNDPEQHGSDDHEGQLVEQPDQQEQEQRLLEAYDRIADLERKNITLEENNQRLLEKVDQQQNVIEAYEKKLSQLPQMIESILEKERKENAAPAASVTPSSLASSPSPRSSPAGETNSIPQRQPPPQDLLGRSHDQSSFSELRSSIRTNKSKPFFASNFAVREFTPAMSPSPKEGEGKDKGDTCDQKLSGGEVRRPRFWKGWGKGSGGSNISNRSGTDNGKTDKSSPSYSGRIYSANSYDSHDASRSLQSQGSSAGGASSSSSNHNQKNAAAAAAAVATLRPSTIITDASAMSSIESNELFSAEFSPNSGRSDNDNRSHDSDVKSNNETMLDLVM